MATTRRKVLQLMRSYMSGILGSATGILAGWMAWMATHTSEVTLAAGCIAAIFGAFVAVITFVVWVIKLRRAWRHRND